MHGGLLARRLSGRLASSLTCQGPFQTAGYATKAPTGASEREKETKLQTLLKVANFASKTWQGDAADIDRC